MKRLIPMLMLAGLCYSNLPAAAAELNESVFAVAPAVVAVHPGPVAATLDHHMKRPAVLPALYVSFGALQAWDVYATSAAMRSGAREANPMMTSVAGHPARVLAVKAASTAATVFFVERLWKQNRVAAVVVLALINGATTAVAMNNVRNARRVR